MQFGNLQFLLLLWLVPALVFFFVYAGMRRRRRILIFCGSLHERLNASLMQGRRRLKAVLMVMAVALLVTALARPRWGYQWEDVKRVGIDIIVAVDHDMVVEASEIPADAVIVKECRSALKCVIDMEPKLVLSRIISSTGSFLNAFILQQRHSRRFRRPDSIPNFFQVQRTCLP